MSATTTIEWAGPDGVREPAGSGEAYEPTFGELLANDGGDRLHPRLMRRSIERWLAVHGP